MVGTHYISAMDWEQLYKLLPPICRYEILDCKGEVIGLRFYSPDGHRESRIMKEMVTKSA